MYCILNIYFSSFVFFFFFFNDTATTEIYTLSLHDALPIFGGLRAEGAMDVPGGEEDDALREAVVEAVEERARGGAAAEPDPEREDPHVLDARVREHPLEVPLADDEDRGERDREETDPDERVARERLLARRAGHLEHADDREEGEVREAAREQRPEQPRRLAVRVGLPGVERREPHLRAVADEQEHERGAHPGPRERGAGGDELADEERAGKIGRA